MTATVGQIRGEWRKVYTLRSQWAIAGLGLTTELVLRTVSAVILPVDAGPGETAFALRPSILFATTVAVLPLLAATSEWRWKLTISTYALQPRRLVVLRAKTVVGAAVGLAVAALLTVPSLLVGRAVLDVRGVAAPPGATLAALTAGPVLTGMAIGCAAVALGTVLREQFAALTVAGFVLFVAPLPLSLIGPRWYAWSPAGWLDAVSGLEGSNPDLPPVPVAALLWAIAAVAGTAVAAWRLQRADVA
jgi:hypothetical protein